MSGIVADGEKRLRKAIESEVRRERAREILNAASLWGRLMIQRKIGREVEQRIKNLSSPGSLYFARRIKSGK